MACRKILVRERVQQLKEQELRFVRILEAQVGGFPSNRLLPTEAPDFVVAMPNGKIGIEVTTLHQQSTPSRSRGRESEQEKIANEAVRIFEIQNSATLEVKIHFSANGEFSK